MTEFQAPRNPSLKKAGFSDLPTEIQDMIFDLIIPPVMEEGFTWAPNGWIPHGSQVSFRKLTYLQTGMVCCLPRHPAMSVSRLWRGVAIRGFWRNGACKLQIGWKQERTSGCLVTSMQSREIDFPISDHWVKNIKYLSLEARDWINSFTNWEISSLFKRSLSNLQYLHLGVENLPRWESKDLFGVLSELPWVNAIAKHPTLKYSSVSKKPQWKTWDRVIHYTNDPEDLGPIIIEHYVRISLKARELPNGIESWSLPNTGPCRVYHDLDLFGGKASAATQHQIFVTLRDMFTMTECLAGVAMCYQAQESLITAIQSETRERERRFAIRREQEAESRRREQRRRWRPTPTARRIERSGVDLYNQYWTPRGSGPIVGGWRLYTDQD